MRAADFRVLKENLPKVPGVLGRDKYFISAVLIPFVFINEEYYFLFERRAPDIRQAGEVCFPGGKYDPSLDADSSKTALRETSEELGLARESIKIEGRLDTLIAPMGALVDVYIGRLSIKSLNELKVNRKEVEDVFLLPVSFFENGASEEYKVRVMVQPSYIDKGQEVVLLPAKELGLPERYYQPWGGAIHRVYVYKTANGPIWGITGEIINDVVKRLPPCSG